MRKLNVVHNALVFRETRNRGQYRCSFVTSKHCPLNMDNCCCREDVGVCTRSGKKGAEACICRIGGKLSTNDVKEWSGVILNKFGGHVMLNALVKMLNSRKR